MRADAGADQVVARLDVGEPVAHGLARCLLQRLRPELDRPHLGAEQAHALDVRALAPHVLGAHVHDALDAEARADGRDGDAVLAGSRLGDDPLLAEPPCEQHLAERVVELVRARVQEVLPLEEEPLAGREALGERERGRPARVGSEQPVELGEERLVPARCGPGPGQLVECGDERLGHVAAAVGAVEADAHERAASTNARTRSASLIPGETSSCELASTAHGRTVSIAARTFSGESLPGEDEASRRSEPLARDATGLPAPRADRRPARRARRRGGAPHRGCGGRSRGHRAGRGRRASSSSSPTSTATESIVSGTGSTRSARRGLSAARMNPARSAPASAAAATSSSRVSPQTLTSGRANELRELPAGIRRAHERRADEHGVGAGQLGRGRLGARLDPALRDDDPVAWGARDEVELGAPVDLGRS